MKKISAVIISFFISGFVWAEEPDVKTTTETFKDWQLTCVENTDTKRCEIKQVLVNQNKQPVAVFSMIKTSKTASLMQITLPHLLDLTVPVKIQIDDKPVASLPYKFCNKVACFVMINDNKTVFDAFKKGSKGELAVKSMGNEEIKLNFSLSGFSAATKNLPVNQ